MPECLKSQHSCITNGDCVSIDHESLITDLESTIWSIKQHQLENTINGRARFLSLELINGKSLVHRANTVSNQLCVSGRAFLVLLGCAFLASHVLCHRCDLCWSEDCNAVYCKCDSKLFAWLACLLSLW